MADVQKAGSALSALKALSKKEKVDTDSKFASTVNDVAVAGAKREKTTVKLGFDPDFAPVAKLGAAAKSALDRATSEFEGYQSQLRDYGWQKRCLWNETMRADDTTVAIPYEVETPTGLEKQWVQVVSVNKYSVRAESVLALKPDLGDSYDRLFVEERVKVLKPNCEEIVRGLLGELGMNGDELETAMSSLFEEKVKVNTAKAYEKEVKLVSPALQQVLEQACTRSQPALRFP